MAGSQRRKAPEVRRQEILDAVVAIAADRGLGTITIRDVAERVSVAPGLIHHYFPSLDALLTESFSDWADVSLQELRAMCDGLSPRMGLAVTVANVTPDQRIWNDALATASRFPQLRERALELSVEYLNHVQGLIVAGVDETAFVCDQPTLAAWRIILMLDGLVNMVHVLGLLTFEEIPTIVGPVVEDQLSLERGSFTELVQVIIRGSQRPA